MLKKLAQALLLGGAFLLWGVGTAMADTSAGPATLAQASPAPAATATPNPLSYGGYFRGYYFTRTNASPQYGLPQSTGVLNQATFNAAINLHAAYAFGSNWSVGGTYLYANPLNNCTTAADQLQTGGPCSGKTATYKSGGTTYLYNPVPTNPDNTLPGFELSTLYEAYLQYKDEKLYAKVGNQLLTTPWANGADTRLKPEAYQGGDFSYKFDKNWTGELAYIDRFESRVDSAFVNSTLLTATNQADAPGPGANLLIPKYSAVTNSGFVYARAGYTEGPVAANLYFYGFADIANAEWFDAKYTLKDPTYKSYVAIQAGNEANAGKAILGKINSQAVGLLLGATVAPNLDLTVGFDYIPDKSDTITLPSGVKCNPVPAQPPVKTPAGNEISVTGTTPLLYFLPTGGTPNCVNNANGTTTVYYGGWASPYTDSYTSDPLYTTSMTGGMVERRSSGGSTKATATWYGDNRQIRLITSFAIYAFGNNVTGVAPDHELDIDGTYYFNHVPKSGPYKGLSLRHRYGDRDMAFVQYYGGLPVFKYNRTQLEYDF